MFMYFWVFQGLSTILENFGTLILIRKWQDFAWSSARRDNADFLLTPHTLSSYCRCNPSDTVHSLITLHNLLLVLPISGALWQGSSTENLAKSLKLSRMTARYFIDTKFGMVTHTVNSNLKPLLFFKKVT